MSSADAIIAALRSGHDSLAQLVSGLGDDDLARQSGSAEWDISQVLSHLGSGAEITQATLQAAFDGQPNPGGDFNTSVWDRWNAMTRRQRADGFLQVNQALTALFESLDAATRENLRIDTGFMPAPIDVATMARLRLSELALHAWDVRVTFDERATLAADAAEPLLRGSDLLAWISKPAALNENYSVIQVTTSQPTSVFTLNLNSPIGVEFQPPHTADGTLSLPAEAWLRLVAGRLAPQHTPVDVNTSGTADIDVLRQVFPGY